LGVLHENLVENEFFNSLLGDNTARTGASMPGDSDFIVAIVVEIDSHNINGCDAT
jgi:hypothetical protein